MSLEDLLENPQWARNWNYATNEAPNNHFYKRWHQGGSGMHTGMFIWSTDLSVLQMKHGTNNPAPYRGQLQPFSPMITPNMQHKVESCIQNTWNASNCIGKGLSEIESHDTNQARAYYNQHKVQVPPFGPQD